MKVTLSKQTVVVAAKTPNSGAVGGETALQNAGNNVQYGLDPLGAQVWSMLQNPRRVGELQDAVSREYAVEPGRCERDLENLLNRMLQAGLIEVHEASA